MIPKSFRDQLDLHPGDEVDFVLRDGEIAILKRPEDGGRLGGRFNNSGMAARLLEDRAKEPR